MNPFLINSYVSPTYFCNRVNETKLLLSNINNKSNTTFFAQRRIGKTALIHHVFHHLNPKKTVGIYIDIYATQNLKEFTNLLANGIYTTFPPNKSIGKLFLESIKWLRPIISIDENGKPELSLDITQPKQFEKTIPQLFQFLETQKISTVIAIDEFQQIINYPEKNVEAILRTVIQRLHNVSFIFCGSNQKMMHYIFNNAKRPFYASTKNINLQKIATPDYFLFIKKHFEAAKFKISNDIIELILDLTDTHTYYVQRLCHDLIEKNKTSLRATVVLKSENVLLTLKEILLENESMYFQYRNLLTLPQWKLLKALAVEEKIERPFAQSFIYKHELGTPAMVKRSMDALIEKEMIYYNTSIKNPTYEVYDKFLMRWLQRI